MNTRKAAYYSAHRIIGSSLGKIYETYAEEDEKGRPWETVKPSLVKILNHCEQNVPYYSAVMREIGDAYRQEPELYLQRLPVLTKEMDT